MGCSEIELKLGLDPADMARLRRNGILAAQQAGRPQTKRLHATYFDTPEFTLAAAGISLRIRVNGSSSVQTVKTAGSRVAGLFAREEWEAPVHGHRPDPGLLRATGLPLFLDEALVARLQPAFTTRVERTLYRLCAADWAVDLALDRGTVEAGPSSEPICEAEFELVEGPPQQLYTLARAVAEVVPARLMTLSKSDRGYRLAQGRPIQPVKASPVALTPTMDVASAFRAIGRGCLVHLLANQHCLLTTANGEAIHQMRVALRRLRSALKLFRSVVDGPQLAEIREGIRWLLDNLGPARDADVFLAEIVGPVIAGHPAEPALSGLEAHWRAERDVRLSAAVTAVAERRFTSLVLSMGEWLEAGDWTTSPIERGSEPLETFAARMLAKSDRKLRKAAAGGLAKLAPDDLHQVRILGKQLRYATEFFQPLLAKRTTKPFLVLMSELQDQLGGLNDIAGAVAKLAESQPEPRGAWAAGLVAGWHQARRAPLLAQAQRTWGRLRRAKRPWAVKDK